jgi:hypothetical protein
VLTTGFDCVLIDVWSGQCGFKCGSEVTKGQFLISRIVRFVEVIVDAAVGVHALAISRHPIIQRPFCLKSNRFKQESPPS